MKEFLLLHAAKKTVQIAKVESRLNEIVAKLVYSLIKTDGIAEFKRVFYQPKRLFQCFLSRKFGIYAIALPKHVLAKFSLRYIVIRLLRARACRGMDDTVHPQADLPFAI